MDISDWVTGALSVFAIAISIIALRKSWKAASASIELGIATEIRASKDRTSDLCIQMSAFQSEDKRTEDEERRFQATSKAFWAAIENNINAYENACAKYADNKVDRHRFKKIYKTEIRKLVQNPKFAKYFDEVKSEYRNILNVYKEWEHLE